MVGFYENVEDTRDVEIVKEGIHMKSALRDIGNWYVSVTGKEYVFTQRFFLLSCSFVELYVNRLLRDGTLAGPNKAFPLNPHVVRMVEQKDYWIGVHVEPLGIVDLVDAEQKYNPSTEVQAYFESLYERITKGSYIVGG